VSTEFYWIAVVATTIISASRLTRLATWDKFPPVVWLRDKYADATDGNGWQILAFCGYCASFWLTGLVVAWGLLSGVYAPVSGNQYDNIPFTAWWIVNGILAASYLAAILMAHDGDDGDDD
jgi:hypothetical protein